MSLADVLAAVMFLGVILYALFGGADFGAGVWDLVAGNARRGGATRRLIDEALGPVWEANHVWLIFVLVYFWTAFPMAFAATMESLFVPFALAALGIVLRGGAFAFRKVSPDLRQARLHGVMFAVSSLLTPFFFGAAAGAVASGRVSGEDADGRATGWIGPTPVIGGLLAVMTSAFLAAVFLAREADRRGERPLADSFRRRGLVVGVVTGGGALASILPLAHDAPTLFHGLTGRALPLLVASAAGGGVALVLLWQRRYGVARFAAGVAVAAAVAAWGVAQYPWLLVDAVTIDDAAGARATMWALLIASGLAALLVVPSLAYLYLLTQRDDWVDAPVDSR